MLAHSGDGGTDEVRVLASTPHVKRHDVKVLLGTGEEVKGARETRRELSVTSENESNHEEPPAGAARA